MSWGKVTQMLGQLSESHDMAKATSRRMTLRSDIQVQVKDAAGFWCVLHDLPTTLKAATVIASDWQKQTGSATRVVTGAKRDVVQEFGV